MAEVIPALKTLDDFVEALSAQRGLHRKVRLLGHYWSQVRDLPSDDRQRIALALGSESAWNRLEKLFGADGHLSEGELTVKRALQRVGSADPAELRALAGRLRSGDYAEVGSELLDAMRQALDAEAGVEPPPEFEPEPGAEPEPAPESMLASVPEPEPESAPRPEPEQELGTAGEPVGPLAMMPSLPPVMPAEVIDLAGPEAESEHRLGQRPIPDPEARAERRRLVTASGTGWRRRRFLGELIRECQLEDLDEALDLTVLLESDVQRGWCLGDLVQHWPLDDEQLAQVLDAAPAESVRARLLRRHERARLEASR